jgi:hypothetical protein
VLPERSGGLAEERKVVTVLFCDLVGSTSRADGADLRFLYDLGDWDELLRESAEIGQVLNDTGHSYWAVMQDSIRALTLAWQGEVEAARATQTHLLLPASSMTSRSWRQPHRRSRHPPRGRSSWQGASARH